MNPYQQQRDGLNNINESPTNNSPEIPNRTDPDRQQQPEHLNGLTMITPNQSKRNNLITMAQKEEEELQKYRERQRSVPVHINPERLGGSVTLQEAREKQFTNQRCSKLQKKLKREAEEKRRKEQEEMEIQKMRDIQREKANRLEQKRQQEDNRRRDWFQSDHSRKNNTFLQQFETTASSSRSAPPPIPNVHVLPKVKKNLEEIQQEHKRTNAAFLDKLEHQMKASNMSAASSSSSTESLDEKSSPRPQKSPELRCSGHTAGEQGLNTASEPDFAWALMKLMTKFPDFKKDELEDFLHQCNGDYEQAYGLLS